LYREVHPLIRNVKDGSVLALVPGGEFEMGDGQGSNCAKHRVHMDGYYIGVYCVTNAQYARFVREGKGREPDNSKWKEAALSGHPVVNVSWDDATAYASWVGCDLATEAQWEKAARGLKGLLYPWGNDWDAGKCLNDKNKGSGQTCAVWEYAEGASGYGTYNQSGNVWEWCRDWYGDYVTAGVQKNPVGPATGSHRVLRGGCWGGVDASGFRGAIRRWYVPAHCLDLLGFRLVRAV
jgi:formylglycine-generating enzyme required for sulfatase activity